jgi:two-component system NtrC family sensor kinase
VNARHSGSNWYQEVMNTGHDISYVTSGGPRDIPHFIMAVKKSRMGKNWVLRTAIDCEVFNIVLKEIGIGNTGSAFIINRDGKYQIGPTHNLNTGEKTLIDFLGIKEGEGSEIFVVQRTNGSGHRNFYVTSFLKEGDWLLVYHQRVSEAFSALRKVKIVAFVVIFIVSLLIVANALSLSKKMVLRIQEADEEKKKLTAQMFETDKLASIGELAAGIAHEINNPVAIMVEEAGWIEDLLEEENLQEMKNLGEFERALKQIHTQGQRCKEITHKLLSFARKTDFKIQKVNLNELINDIMSISSRHSKYNRVKIELDIHEDLPEFMLPTTELQQMLLNLVNNAIDAMEEAGGTLSISARLEGTDIVIKVSDDGLGIPEENLSQIFDPFFTTKPVGKGTGLGLSICYGIAKRMGGEIHVKSVPGSGTIFQVTIPAVKSEEASVNHSGEMIDFQQHSKTINGRGEQ